MNSEYNLPPQEQVTPQPDKRLQPELKLEGNEWVLPNDTRLMLQVIQAVEQRLRAAGWDESQCLSLPIGVEEATRNAIIHGNLGVPRAPADSEESYRAKIKAAEQSEREAVARGEHQAKHVYLTLRITSDEAVFTIRDDGKGFNPEAVPDPTADENQYREGGRGVFLMRRIFGQVEFRGNTVVMTKHRTPLGEQSFPTE